MKTYEIDHAIRVEIRDNYELASAWLQWLIAHPEIFTFRGGSSGRGNVIAWLPAENEPAVKKFFEVEDYHASHR